MRSTIVASLTLAAVSLLLTDTFVSYVYLYSVLVLGYMALYFMAVAACLRSESQMYDQYISEMGRVDSDDYAGLRQVERSLRLFMEARPLPGL